MFTLENTSPRKGTLLTSHGPIQTPFFMPVATTAALKGLSFDDLHDLEAQLTLCNTYHLHLQPGEDIVDNGGGLHNWMHWNKPILTDSGGFQVFSLRNSNKITDTGVTFQSHIDGSKRFIGPEESITIQHKLGADIIMVFDECPPSTADRATIKAAVDRTLLWAKKSKEVHERLCAERAELRAKQREEWIKNVYGSTPDWLHSAPTKPLLFCIVQGGLERDLREYCTKELISIGFDGYAVGGLAVGETEHEMYSVLDTVCPLLPEDAPRYLMGVGLPHQLEDCCKKGIDMYDCVLPMRVARHGTVFMSDGSHIRIQNAKYAADYSLIDQDSPSTFSRQYTKSYLHHLFKAHERYAETIACKQNLAMLLETTRTLRA